MPILKLAGLNDVVVKETGRSLPIYSWISLAFGNVINSTLSEIGTVSVIVRLLLIRRSNVVESATVSVKTREITASIKVGTISLILAMEGKPNHGILDHLT